MNKHQQTAYGLKTLIYRLFNLPPQIDQYTTVNERLQILPDVRPTPTEPVAMGIMVAGNKGHSMTLGEDGIPLTGVRDHTATDASLYGQLPFAICDMDNDLSAAERARYCLRKTIQINGINKIAYYGLRIPVSNDNLTVQMVRVTRTEQGSEEQVFIPNNENLFPEPPELPVTGAVTTSNVSVRVNAMLRVNMTSVDIGRFVEAVKELYNGDERYAVMSEFGLCTAANRMVEVTNVTGTINFNEAIGTQIYAFTMEHKALYYNTTELSIDFDLGNQIPLFAPESIPTMQVID